MKSRRCRLISSKACSVASIASWACARKEAIIETEERICDYVASGAGTEWSSDRHTPGHKPGFAKQVEILRNRLFIQPSETCNLFGCRCPAGYRMENGDIIMWNLEEIGKEQAGFIVQ